jgi:hypothetical protein
VKHFFLEISEIVRQGKPFIEDFVERYITFMNQYPFIPFFIMMCFILLGGLYTPIESMLEWALVN